MRSRREKWVIMLRVPPIHVTADHRCPKAPLRSAAAKWHERILNAHEQCLDELPDAPARPALWGRLLFGAVQCQLQYPCILILESKKNATLIGGTGCGRPLLLRVSNQNVRRQSLHRFDQRAAPYALPEVTVECVETRKSRKCSEVYELTTGLIGIAGSSGESGGESGGEVADPVDVVLWEQGLGALAQIHPPEWFVFQGAVVEIEAVNVDVGFQ